MIVGFTGTQAGMSVEQTKAVARLLAHLKAHQAREFHHGNCIGADDEAAKLANQLGYYTVAWPGPDLAKRGSFESDVCRAPRGYLVRNREIVLSADLLIAAPKTFSEMLRSGTWATVRYARRDGKPVYVCQPNGQIDKEVRESIRGRLTPRFLQTSIDLRKDTPL